jgi:hypothetical protein
MLALQATAGNAAVTGLLSGGLAVQRHKGVEPEIAAAHTMTADEKNDLPTVAESADLRTEQAALRAEKAAAAKAAKDTGVAADKTRMTQIDDRLAVIARKLGLRRTKGDEDETLKRNGIAGGSGQWFADVHTVRFLGHSATVHKRLADRLTKAEAALQGETAPPDGWVREGHSTLRPPREGLHSFGLAIDLNPHSNPWLVNPNDANATLNEGAAQSAAVARAVDRAVLLILGRPPAEEKFFARPKEKDKDARVTASYEKLEESSAALVRYLGLDAEDKKKELADLVEALGPKNPKGRSAQTWRNLITADRAALQKAGQPKHWTDPTKGFLDLDKRLVAAMTDSTGAGLTWLGDDTIASGRDIMHFDLRGAGPITKVWDSATGKDIYLGDG